ncbi:MAG: carboxypeptidase-like regulatory domain-containing protein [Bacteroidota bacterium]|nr:carboxypeptidase-like regulatory domain-containing protein [Bacteroidota bacterium]
MKKVIVLLICLLSASLIFANNSDDNKKVKNEPPVVITQIQGSVLDVETGSALVGVKIKLEGSNESYYTDLDGNFFIEGLTPGNYNIIVSYVSYEENTLKDINVKNSRVYLNIKLDQDNE